MISRYGNFTFFIPKKDDFNRAQPYLRSSIGAPLFANNKNQLLAKIAERPATFYPSSLPPFLSEAYDAVGAGQGLVAPPSPPPGYLCPHSAFDIPCFLCRKA